MKAAESEAPDAHFTVDKQNISLWPRGKHQSLLRTCSVLGFQSHHLLAFNKCSLFLPTEPPPKTGSPLVLRKPCTVRAVVIVLMLVVLASILLQAILCKSSGLIIQAWSFSRARWLPRHPDPLFPALQWSLPPMAFSFVLLLLFFFLKSGEIFPE